MAPTLGRKLRTVVLPAHNLERLSQASVRGADVAGDGHGVGARADRGRLGRYFGESGEEGGHVWAAGWVCGWGRGG